jgi:hypothetical protein
MFFKKRKQVTDTFRDRIDAALAQNPEYQQLAARREAIVAERATLETQRDNLRAALSNRMSAGEEAAAIAAGTVSPTAGDPKGSQESLASASHRIGVLQSALEQLNDQIVLMRQATGEQLYRDEFMPEQREVAAKILDLLLDLAATRVEERTRLHDLQTAGITIMSLPRCTPKLASGMYVDEFARDVQALGLKLTTEQSGRLAGVLRDEAAI